MTDKPTRYEETAMSGESQRVFKSGDRVHHDGRKENGTVLSFDPDTGTVRIEFDNPTPRGNRSIGEFDEVWFNTHEGWLTKLSQ